MLTGYHHTTTVAELPQVPGGVGQQWPVRASLFRDVSIPKGEAIGHWVWRMLFAVVSLVSFGGTSELSGQETTIRNLSEVNTEESEFSPAFYGEELVFVHQPVNGKVDPRTGTVFYELFRTNPNGNGRKRARPFSIELNSSFHEGPVSFSRDQRQIFFTRTNMRRGVSQSDERGRAGLKIYYAFRGPYDEWLGTRELEFNSDNFSCMHPTLSPDGQRLFFASDQPGGFGGLDIYLSEWDTDHWGPPINLGPEVNTSKNEAFPFVHDSGRLFFSSNGHAGKGGLDMYIIDLSGRSWGKVYNLPEPFNSPYDDFGLILDSLSRTGYLSSNRPGGSGKDDLFQFSVPGGLEAFTGNSSQRELLTVYDASTSQRLRGAQVWLTEIGSPGTEAATPELITVPDGSLRLEAGLGGNIAKAGEKLQTDQDGHADLILVEGKSYRLMVHKSGFAPGEIRFNYGPNGPSRPLELVLQPAECILISGFVSEEVTEKAISGATIKFYPVDCQQQPIAAVSEQDGYYYACIPAGCNYQIVVQHPLYEELRSSAGTVRIRLDRLETDLQLKAKGGINQADVLQSGALIILEQLQYEDNRYRLTPGPVKELDLLLGLLRQRPGLTILLENHTETSGPSEYNMDLSQRRVDAVFNYLVARGVNPMRIQTRAHGENVPRNHCGTDENCSAEEHQKNRRTEVRILSTGS